MIEKDQVLRGVSGLLAICLTVGAAGCAKEGESMQASTESEGASSGQPGDRAGPFTLDGAPADPFGPLEEHKALAFVFVTVDCPIANRYAPTILELYDRFRSKGIDFTLVYTDPDRPIAKIRKHKKDYGYPFRAIRDPNQALVRHAEVEVTPEVAVYEGPEKLLYRGRINNRFVDFGKTRPEATQHDLKRALEAIVADRPIETRMTEAVGCYIPDPMP